MAAGGSLAVRVATAVTVAVAEGKVATAAIEAMAAVVEGGEATAASMVRADGKVDAKDAAAGAAEEAAKED